MNPSLAHLSDAMLVGQLDALERRDRVTTAELLVHLAEVDARRLYARAGYQSMYAWCVEERGYSEDVACKRIRAAKAAREFPAILAAVAEGRVHLSAVVTLAPHLTGENAAELIAAASCKSKCEIERLLAARFPQPDLVAEIEPLAAPAPSLSGNLSAPGRITPGPVRADAQGLRPMVKPLSPQRYGIQFTIGQSTQDKLTYAQELLGHQIPRGDLTALFDRALDALIAKLEKQRFAATDKPRSPRARREDRPTNPRHIPAEVQRAVWERDQGRCTFVSGTGRRCEATGNVEFDHIEPVARGGRATIGNLRLRCRTHNQYEAERTFGAGFMRKKRDRSRRAAGAGRSEAGSASAQGAAMSSSSAASASASTACAHGATATAPGPDRDVTPWLRALGFRADQARRATAHCEAIPDAPLEDRVRAAISFLGGPHQRPVSHAA